MRAADGPPGRVVLMSPQGRPLHADDGPRVGLVQDRLILVAGHYEGFDERIRLGLADARSAWATLCFRRRDARHGRRGRRGAAAAGQPGLDPERPRKNRFPAGLLEYPQYTRPRDFRGMSVPEMLLGGDHARIAAWRAEQSKWRTQQRRPDLWDKFRQDNPDE